MELGPKKILVVDDDLGTYKIIKKWLSGVGYEVSGTLNGEDGLKEIKKEPPDLLLLDLMLPNIGGVEVAVKIKSDEATKNIPIIFMSVCVDDATGQGEEEIMVNGESHLALSKPLKEGQLLKRVRTIFNEK